MPTYQYRCTACGEPLEVVQSFTDDPLTECPDCGGELRKVFSSVGIVFKGSGFYRTDSRAGSDKQKATADSSASSSSDGGSSSTKDSGSKDSGSKDSTPASSKSTSESTSSSKGSGSSTATSAA